MRRDFLSRVGDVRKTLSISGFGKAGSPSVSEIELKRVLRREWANVVKWLNNLDLLRAGGLDVLPFDAWTQLLH
jgi:hypothetical protein